MTSILALICLQSEFKIKLTIYYSDSDKIEKMESLNSNEVF